MAFELAAQRPAFTAAGVANTASYNPAGVIRPGAIVSIFGTDLSVEAATADSSPLPRELVGTSVTINGLSAPLFFVSPTQINLQVPFQLVPFGERLPATVPVVVKSSRGTSETVDVGTAAIGGVFTTSGAACGPAAALNSYPDGSSSIVSSTNAVIPGEFFSVFGTGLGAYRSAVEGEPALQAWEAPTTAMERFRLEVGYAEFGTGGALPLWAGLAPGLIGVEQGIFRLLSPAPEGCAIPIRVTRDLGGGRSTQTVTLPISRTGKCVDPSISRFARLRWTRTFRSTPEGMTTTLSFRARFVSAFESLLPVPRPIFYLDALPFTERVPPTKQCPGSEPDPVNVGSVTLATGIRTIQIPQADIYEIVIRDDAASNREWSVTASGSPQIQPFRAGIALPEPLKFTADLRPGTVIPYGRLVPLAWSGGRAGASVYLRVTMDGFRRWETTTDAERGETYLPGSPLTGPIPLNPSENVTLHFVVLSKAAAPITIPGFPAGAVHEWVDEYIFTGLRIRNTPPSAP